eukprot:4698823-Pyramimonas_sp.AAC.1
MGSAGSTVPINGLGHARFCRPSGIGGPYKAGFRDGIDAGTFTLVYPSNTDVKGVRGVGRTLQRTLQPSTMSAAKGVVSMTRWGNDSAHMMGAGSGLFIG